MKKKLEARAVNACYLQKLSKDLYHVWLPNWTKITTTIISDFILQQADSTQKTQICQNKKELKNVKVNKGTGDESDSTQEASVNNKEAATESIGKLVAVVKQQEIDRNDERTFPGTDGGDVVQEFALARKRLIRESATNKTRKPKEKRKFSDKKRKTRPSTNPPRNMTEAKMRPDFKKCAAAHDAKLERHDTKPRT